MVAPSETVKAGNATTSGDALARPELLARLPLGGMLLAARAYDTNAIRAEPTERDTFANAPSRVIRRRSVGLSPWLYRQRNQIERFVNCIQKMYRFIIHYDRCPDNFLAALKLAAARIWIKAYDSAP